MLMMTYVLVSSLTGAVITSIIQMQKLRLRELLWLVHAKGESVFPSQISSSLPRTAHNLRRPSGTGLRKEAVPGARNRREIPKAP
jgi:hypothetical protein